MFVVAQTYYHNWRASVDGRFVPLLRANYTFQAVEIPAGHHEVRLTYVDRLFQIGAIISSLAVMGCVFTLWRNSRSDCSSKT
jgi:uncharacterized membrane protein YfhO